MPEITFLQAINEALREEMRRNPTVFIMGEDVRIGVFGTTRGLVNEFGPNRVLNTPISEAGIAGAGVGAAMVGMRPIVEIQFASFFYCCYDQVCNQAAKLRYMSGGQFNIPITFCTVYGMQGSAAAQHSETVYGQFMNVPGLKIVVPSSSYDMKGLLKTAIRDDNPVLVFEHARLGGTKEMVPEDEYLIPFGKAAIKRAGKDVTVVAIGLMVQKAMAAATILQKEGVSIEVVDPRTLVPLDEETILDSVKKTGRVVIVDEGHLRSGMASEIAALIADKGFDYLDGPIQRVAALDVPIPFSPPLEQFVIPDEAKIVVAVKALME